MIQRGMTILHTIGSYAALALIALLPVVFFPVPWATIPHAKMTAVVVFTTAALLAWVAATVVRRTISIPVSPVIAAAVLLPVAYAVSALVAGGSAPSFVGSGVERDTVAAMVMWFAAMAGSVLLLSSGRLVVRAYQLLLGSVGLVALFHLARLVFGPHPLLFGGILTGPAASVVGSWHDLGILLGLGILLAAAALSSKIVAGVTRWMAWGVVAIGAVLLIVINERDVWMSLAAVSALGSFYFWFTTPSEREERAASGHVFALRIFSVLFAVALAFSFLVPYVYNVLPDRFEVAQLEVRPSWEGTAAVANSVYNERSLLFGSGPNTFVREWGFYKPAGVNETAFWNADFLQGVGFIPTAIITTGLFGALAWGAFLLTLLYSGFRTLFSRRVLPQWRVPLFALFGTIVYLWTMHVIYPPGSTLLALAFVLTGLFVAAQRAAGVVPTTTWELNQTSRTGFIVSGAVVIIGLTVLLASVGIGRALASDMLVNRSITVYNTTQDFTKAQQNLRTALFLHPNSDRGLRAAVEMNLLRFAEIASSDAPEARQEELRAALEQAIQNGLSAVSANSGNYQNWMTLAQAYEQLVGVQVEGAYENARSAYERAIAENPTNPTAYLQLARLAAAQSDLESARAYIEEALVRKQNYAPAYLLLSQIEVTAENMSAAQQAATAAVQSAPNEPVTWFQFGVILYSQENYDTAVTALEQAVSLNANYANALYVLGLAYEQTGRSEDALAALERVASLNAGNEQVAQLMASIRAGELATTEEGAAQEE